MKIKLTLRLEDDVIGRAKAYAAQRGTSVSALVEDYFRLLASSDPGGDGASDEEAQDPDGWRNRLSPRVRELLGSARGVPPNVTENVTEEDYRAYLAEKHR